MNFFFSKKNKKGMEMQLSEIIMLVFGGLILIALIAFIYNLQAAVLSEPDEGSIANFNRLYKTIKELIESSDDRNYRVINFFTNRENTLVGFDTDWYEDPSEMKIIADGESYLGDDEPIYRPFKCGNSACLCLYDMKITQDPNKRNEGIIECRSDGLSSKNIEFVDLNLYRGLSILERVVPIYIEKTYGTDKKYVIYINRIDITNLDDEANIRKKDIDKYKKPPICTGCPQQPCEARCLE